MLKEIQVERGNPFSSSAFIENVQASHIMHVHDLDENLAGPAALAVQRLETAAGVGRVFVSSRKPNMMLSSSAYVATMNLAGNVYQEEKPHLATHDGGQTVYAPPESLAVFQGVLDPDIIAGSTGTRLLVAQQDGGYRLDADYERGVMRGRDDWRVQAWRVVKEINGDDLGAYPGIEFPDNFANGAADVLPLDGRIQINFTPTTDELLNLPTGYTGGRNVASAEALGIAIKKMQEFQRRFAALKEKYKDDKTLSAVIGNMRLSNDSNHRRNRATLYITPQRGNKAHALEHLVTQAVKQTGIARSELSLLITGDSIPDVSMGLYGGVGTNATFLLARGSRLKDVFLDPTQHEYVGAQLGQWKDFKDRLEGDPEGGVLRFKSPFGDVRTILLGDILYPHAETSSDAIFSVVQERLKKVA